MSYGYYCEGWSNGVFVRQYLEGYKTPSEAERAAAEFKESHKIAETGHVLFKFTGGAASKYCPQSYRVVSRYNAKTFFDFWG